MNSSSPRRTFLCLFAISILGLARFASAQNVVVNGGFDDSDTDFTGWTLNDPDGFANVGINPLFSQSLPNHANLTATPDTGSLSQTLNTMAGQTYTLTFWLANDGGANMDDTNTFQAKWNGTSVLSLTNADPFNYTEYTYSLLATSSSTVLEFDFHNDADYFRLDTVSAVGPVPEPSVAWLGLTGAALLGGAVGLRRRFARQS